MLQAFQELNSIPGMLHSFQTPDSICQEIKSTPGCEYSLYAASVWPLSHASAR